MKLYTAIFAGVALLYGNITNGQTSFSFAPPMKIEPKLSANFGEIRKNHFHSGLDYRTESRTGIPVYAVEDGYVARIFVSPSGFGKAIYINHGTKYTSVYGHLESFSPDIERFVINQQYLVESFSINEFPNKNLLPVKKGDLIGFSGNSGSSGGPHLHFEVRDQHSEEPLNPLGNKLIYIEDNIPPKIKTILIYQIDTVKNIAIPSINKEIAINTDFKRDTITVPSQFFIGVETFDNMPNSTNEYLVKRLTVEIDSVSFYNFDMTKFAFDESKYVNSIIDYNLFNTKKREVIRIFKDPNNKFSVLSNMKNSGIVTLKDSKPHLIVVKATDNNGNESHVPIWIRGESKTVNISYNKDNQIPIYFFKSKNQIVRPNATISIPGSSLYNSMFVSYKEEPNSKKFSPACYIGDRTQSLLAKFELKIKAHIPKKFEDKAFIARGSNSSFSSIGGDYCNGYISATSSEFGRFFVDIDTVAPKINPKLTRKKELNPTNGILYFTVTDDKTGIDSYDIYIDEKWVIGEYDSKTNLIFVKLDSERIGKGKKHEIEFYISDNVGNTDFFESSFYF
jgi:murein DD-endopeptidase MepM/ murein hydrolase activator NlpD